MRPSCNTWCCASADIDAFIQNHSHRASWKTALTPSTATVSLKLSSSAPWSAPPILPPDDDDDECDDDYDDDGDDDDDGGRP